MTPQEFLNELLACYIDENAGIDPRRIFEQTHVNENEPFEHYDNNDVRALEAALDDIEESGVFDSHLWSETMSEYMSDLSLYCKSIKDC